MRVVVMILALQAAFVLVSCEKNEGATAWTKDGTKTGEKGAGMEWNKDEMKGAGMGEKGASMGEKGASMSEGCAHAYGHLASVFMCMSVRVRYTDTPLHGTHGTHGTPTVRGAARAQIYAHGKRVVAGKRACARRYKKHTWYTDPYSYTCMHPRARAFVYTRSRVRAHTPHMHALMHTHPHTHTPKHRWQSGQQRWQRSMPSKW